MKKRAVVVSVLLSASLFLTGCSWSDIAAKFTGADTGSTQSSGDKDYVAADCVTLAEYKGVEVDCTVSDDELQSEIDSTLSSHSTENKIKKGTCKKGDTVSIDFVGKIDGREFDNGSAEDYSITLGSSGFIDGFDDGVIGMKVGKKKDLKLRFPDDYGKDELNGKDVVFTVTLNYISETVTPEFNDEFVANNTENKTVDEFKTATRQNLSQQKKDKAGETAFGTIEEGSEVKTYPESLVSMCSSQLDAYYRYMSTQYGFEDFNAFLTQMQMNEDSYKQMLDQSAQSIAKTQLVAEAIAVKEGIAVSDEEIKEEITNAVSQGGQTEEDLRKSFQELYGDVITIEEYYRITLTTNKVVDFVGENAKIVE